MNVSKTRKVDNTANEHAGLAGRIARWTAGRNRLETPIQGLNLHRWETPTEPTSYMMAPSICLIGQGKKRLFLGDETYVYDADRFLVTSIDLPVVTQIIEASPDRPYLGLTLELDLRVIAQLMLDRELPPFGQQADRLGIAVSKVPEALSDAFCRLVDLLGHPEDVPVLGPLIKQEISYRLLTGEQGPRLRQMAAVGNHGYHISRVIDWLKQNYHKPARIEELAGKAGLSPSAFHNHFRAVTAMSPLQYQKRMRLNEARRLMLTDHLDAAGAAFKVGYESASQFSREYARQFGAPPMRDIKTLIEETAA